MDYSIGRLPKAREMLSRLVLYDLNQIVDYVNLDRQPETGNLETDNRYPGPAGSFLLPLSENAAQQGALSGPEDAILVVIVEPWTMPKITWISNTLHTKQHIVGGFIEVVYPYADSVAIIVNEEGKLTGLPLNRSIGADIIAGTFIICGLDEQNASFASLTDQQAEYYAARFKNVEIYLDPSFEVN